MRTRWARIASASSGFSTLLNDTMPFSLSAPSITMALNTSPFCSIAE